MTGRRKDRFPKTVAEHISSMLTPNVDWAVAPEKTARGIVLDRLFWEDRVPAKEFLIQKGMACSFRDYMKPWDPGEAGREMIEMMAWMAVREPFIHQFSFAMPCREVLDLIASHSRSIVEVGAGTGFWASLLARTGVDIVATDIGLEGDGIQKIGTHFPVIEQEATAAVLANPERDLMVIWPYKGPWLTRAVKALAPGRCVIFCGEPIPEMGADEEFFDMVENENLFEPLAGFEMVRFPGMKDRLFIVRKRTEI